MKVRSDRHPRIPVATTPEEFDACFASGEAFEASEDVAAEMEYFPSTEEVISDEEYFGPPGDVDRSG